MSFLSNYSVKIPLKTKFGLEFFPVSDIVYFFIENRNVKAQLSDGNTVRVFHTLIELESYLAGLYFYRCHAVTLINLGHIRKYNHKTCIVELSNNLTVKVACYRKVRFNNMINSMLPPPHKNKSENFPNRNNIDEI